MFHSRIEVTATRYHESTKCHQIIHFKWFILCYGNSISTCIFFLKLLLVRSVVSTPARPRSLPSGLSRPECRGAGGPADPSRARPQVFLKETQRQALQETLHREVVRKILLLQSWFRMVLERRHFLQTRRAAILIQVPGGPAGRGARVAGVTRTQPLNAPSTLRPAGGPTASAGHWRGRRRPCSSRPRGGATGSGQPTGARDRASSASRASAGGTYSARGEQDGTEHPPPNPPEHSTHSTLKRYLR